MNASIDALVTVTQLEVMVSFDRNTSISRHFHECPDRSRQSNSFDSDEFRCGTVHVLAEK